MRIIFAAGGTGGHIYPAIAVANEIRNYDKNSEILFIGAKGRIEEKIVPANNFNLRTINITGFNIKNILNTIKTPYKILSSVLESKKILGEFSPEAVVGTGGFVCGPVIYAAYKMKIPVLLQEGNSYPGKVIRYFAGKADKVVVNFDDTLKYLKRKDNVVKIPHPVRLIPDKINKTKAAEYFGFMQGNPVLFVFGGSQGARAINEAVLKYIDLLCNRNINLIWQTGKQDYGKIKSYCEKFSSRVKVFEFIEKMQYAYSASDLVVCRAGISSIMELALLKMPAILIPLPSAAENHQEKNAISLEKKNACIILHQKNIREKLYSVIIETLNDVNKLSELGKNIGEISDKDSAKKIISEVFKIIK